MQDLEHVLSGYFEALAGTADLMRVYVSGAAFTLKEAYFEDRHPGLLIGADEDDREVMIPLHQIVAVHTLEAG